MTINLKKTFSTANKTTIRKADIAKACGVSRQMVQHWFTGTIKPNEKHTQLITDLFKSKGIKVFTL